MDDEADRLIATFRAATSTDAGDATRRAIFAALAQRTAPAVLPLQRGSSRTLLVATLAIAAAMVLAWALTERSDAQHLGVAASHEQAIDRAHARDTGGSTTTRGAEQDTAAILPAIPEPPPAAVDAAPVVVPPRPSPPRVQAPLPAPSALPEHALAREAALIRSAREAAIAGDRARARAAIDTHTREFPRGTLVPERWVLRIELDCAGGNEAQARRDAAAFFAAYPGSGKAATLRTSPCDPMTSRPKGGQ